MKIKTLLLSLTFVIGLVMSSNAVGEWSDNCARTNAGKKNETCADASKPKCTLTWSWGPFSWSYDGNCTTVYVNENLDTACSCQ
jgi:hypothetical protein